MTDSVSSEADQRKSRIAGLFSRAASTYDQVGPRFFTHYGRRLVELAQVSQGASVLDIASGRGASLFPAAERVGPTGRAIGIDLAESMVEEAIHEIRLRGLGNVEARVMDAENLLFPNATFDYVLCGFCLFFFPQHRLGEKQTSIGNGWMTCSSPIFQSRISHQMSPTLRFLTSRRRMECRRSCARLASQAPRSWLNRTTLPTLPNKNGGQPNGRMACEVTWRE